MASNVFRQKNLDKINSPESLNDYVKVTNPSVWIILTGILILIIGAFIFSAFGTVDTNKNLAVSVTNGDIMAYMDENDISSIDVHMTIKIDGTEYAIRSIPDRPIKVYEVDEYVLHKANMESVEWVYPIEVEGTLKDGAYIGTVTVEHISPISYIFN